LSITPGVVDLLGGIGPICVYPFLSAAVISSIHPCARLRRDRRSSLSPVDILRLAANPITRSENKLALSFQLHAGLPSLQPDVAMLLL
jgi:hypothetical protein